MKKSLLLVLVLMLVSAMLFSCKIGGGNNNDNNNDGNTGDNNTGGGSTDDNNTGDGSDDGSGGDSTDQTSANTIFGNGISTYIVSDYNLKDETDKKRIISLINAIAKVSKEQPSVRYSDETPMEHEIVIGDTGRDISEAAYEKLNAKIKRTVRNAEDEDFAEKDTVGYAVYATGGSVAIVWSDFHLRDMAFDYFFNYYLFNSSLVLKEGYLKTEVFSLSEWLEERGEQIKAAAWKELENNLVYRGYASGIISQLKKLYSLYTEENYIWLANLYEPYICYCSDSYLDCTNKDGMCGGGGMYWSDSARDNVGFYPDLEDTYELYGYIEGTGMAEWFGGDAYAASPLWLHDQVYKFFYNLQDENGFFYHPQWPKEYIEANGFQSRVTRDHGSAKTVFNNLYRIDPERYPGPKYPYDGVKDSETELTASIASGRSTVSAVSKVVAVADQKEFLWQYKSPEAFDEYLALLDEELANYPTFSETWCYHFYSYGNTFQSTTSYINADKTGRMKKALETFFNKHQNPENGMWGAELSYNMTNGIHKIASVYNSLGLTLQYTDEMVETVIEICSWVQKDANGNDTYTSSSTDMYNAWSCFPYIYENIRKWGSGSQAQNEAKAKEIVATVYSLAPDMIGIAFDHIVGLRDDNGAFFYSRTGHNSTAQGCPISVSGIAEANVNGNGIATIALIQHILGALEVEEYMVPFYTEADRIKFISILEELQPVVKHTEELGVKTFYDFENIADGDIPEDITVGVDANRDTIEGSYIKVQKIKGNRVLEFVAKDKTQDNQRNYSATFPIQNLSVQANAAVIEFDLWVAPESEKQKSIEFSLRDTKGGAAVICPAIVISSDGTLSVTDTMYSGTGGAKICDIGKTGTVIDFRIEYFWEEGEYKIYSDGLYRGSGYTTYGTKHQKVGMFGMGSASSITANYWIDNASFECVKKQYVDGRRELADEKSYNFNVAQLPTDITVDVGDGSYDVSNGMLNVTNVPDSKSPIFTVPVYIRSFVADSTVIEADIIPSSDIAAGSVTNFIIYNAKDLVLFNVELGIDNNGYYYLNGSKSFAKTSTTVKAEKDAPVNLRLEYYSGLGIAGIELGLLVYINDTLVVTSMNSYTVKYITTLVDRVTLGAPEGASVNVSYDNIKAEMVPTSASFEFPYPELPTVTPGDDKHNLNFEDRNVGTENLPDRITGDAEIGAELDGSNRYLQIVDLSADEEKSVIIAPYGSKENADFLIYEFDIEYLTSIASHLSTLYLVDDAGNEFFLFAIKEVPYSGTPFNQIRMFNKTNGVMDSAPNVVSRQGYYLGLGYATPTSETTVKIKVDLNTGTITATYRDKATITYTEANFDAAALKIVSEKTGTSILTIDNLWAEFVSADATYEPTVENFEGNYSADEEKWNCTHSDALGVESSVTNLTFESGITVNYGTGSNTNLHGATASVITGANGNKYVNIFAPKRVGSRDRSHGITLTPETCALTPNGYAFEFDFMADYYLADRTESHKSFFNIIIYSTNGKYVQYTMTTKDGQIAIGGVVFANWDEWTSVRMEFHAEQHELQLYTKNESGEYVYRGSLTVSNATDNNNKSLETLEGKIATVSFGGTNDKASGFSFNLDNVYLASTMLTYVEGQTATTPAYKEHKPLPPLPSYDITFEADGETVTVLNTVCNEAITLPDAPAKDGYKFEGWFFDNGVFEQQLTANTLVTSPLTGNVTVYAKYRQVFEYDVTFKADGEVVTTVRTEHNIPITLPVAPEKADYRFEGWFFDDGVFEQQLTEDYFVNNPLSDNVTVYAKYTEIIKFNVNFVVDGEIFTTVRNEYNVVIEIPEAPEKSGYMFEGWFLEDGTELTANTFVNSPLTEDVTVNAVYTKFELGDPNAPNYGDEVPGADEVVVPDEDNFGDWYE